MEPENCASAVRARQISDVTFPPDRAEEVGYAAYIPSQKIAASQAHMKQQVYIAALQSPLVHFRQYFHKKSILQNNVMAEQ